MTDLSNAGNDPMRSDDAANYYGDPAESAQAAAQQDAERGAVDYNAASGVDDGAADVAPAAEQSSDGISEKSAVVLMVVLLVLAIIASVVMLFATSTGWMKIAVLLALWSAVIGVVLATRYRKTIALERKRLATIEELHRVELDRELATHREQELILEQNYLDSLEGDNDDNIAALRAEVFALRAQLAEFMGEDFDDQQVALRARAERLRELDSPQSDSPLKNPAGHDRPTPRATSHREAVTANGTVGAHTQHGGAAASQVEDAEATDMRRTFSPAGQPVDVPEVADLGEQQEQQEPQEKQEEPEESAREKFSTGSFRAIHWQETPAPSAEERAGKSGQADQEEAPRRGAHSAWGSRRPFAADAAADADRDADSPTRLLPKVDHDEDDADEGISAETKAETRVPPHGHGESEVGAAEEQAEAPASAPSAHGRRRAEDNKGSLTVAELMAQMRQKKN